MKRSLALKWVVTLLATSLIGVGLVAVFAYRATSNEFDKLRFTQLENEFVSTVSDYYTENGSWGGLDRWLIETNPPPPRPPNPSPYAIFALVDVDGVVVKSAGHYEIGDQVAASALAEAVPVEVDGVQIGRIVPVGPPNPPNSDEERYLDRIGTAVVVGALGAVGAAVVVGILLSQRFMRPLNELTVAIRAMRQGQLGQRVPVRTTDELGELSSAFNQMSSELERVNNLRRQMTADIAHELRTPLTVITGYLEGLGNGTLRPTPERLEMLHTEALQLSRLVEDLRTLSLADAGELKLRPEPTAPADLLKRTATLFEGVAAEQNVTLDVQAAPALPLVPMDPERMIQVLTNLTSNALRYAPQGSRITLSARQTGGTLEISVRDQGEGIPADKLMNIFERFYSADESRTGSETGLGLAIVKSIVSAHGGSVAAESEVGAGTTVTVRLPTDGESSAR
jgi:signal transduction histidine kinase